MLKTKLTYAIGDKVIYKTNQGAKLGIIERTEISIDNQICYRIGEMWYGTDVILEFVSPADAVSISTLNLKV